MHIGIAGVGKMGAAIAAWLMEVGNQVTVWNRSSEKTKPLADAGAKIAVCGVESEELWIRDAKLTQGSLSPCGRGTG
jgi:3-hydroxyisobutyrate dehydrogenase-like beta-hydroxyacid dehydrogenase